MANKETHTLRMTPYMYILIRATNETKVRRGI